ncbi:MAG: alpha/beta hydrolase [Methylophilaceae bacterium]|nr:MAG: alpha/beta hydrolase [Methylophilaceae bacterium]
MQLHYKILGQGQPLILLHGLFGSADNWGAVAKHFSQHYQTISVDLRNHGRSPHHDSQSYPDMAEDIIELCDALKLDTIHLLGHSLGGKTAMQFATQYPERVDKLIVVDMAIRTYPDKQTHLMEAMMTVDLSSMQSRSEVSRVLSDPIPNAMVRQFLLMNLVKVDDGLQWRINLTALKANYSAIRQSVCASAQYDKPCLFIRGEHSDYVRDEDVEEIKNHFTKAQFTSLPTGHWVHAEQPQAFIEVVAQFLTS